MTEKNTVKQIWAFIPYSLYEELLARNKLRKENNWDSWLSNVISDALDREGEWVTGKGDSDE